MHRDTIGHDGKPRILIFATSFEPAVKAGGPVRTLTNLVHELDSDFTVDVVAPDRDLGDSEPFQGLSGRRVERASTTVYYLDASSPRQIVSLLRLLARNRYDLIMVNSIWNARFALVPVLLTSVGALRGPALLLAHGELEPGALALKSGKKRLAGPALRRIYSHRVSVFGATSDAEAHSIAAWFPSSPVVMTTNNLPDTIPWGEPTAPSTQLRALFLSRIHPTKGLLPLLLGLGRATRGIHLSIVGPTQDPSYWQRCLEVIATLPDHVTVTRHEFAPRAAIPALLWNSDCMVLLTAGENYGHVIAEALQAGCPVITTPTTPWTAVIAAGGGSVIDKPDNPAHVALVLDTWAAKSHTELARARRDAREAFDTFALESGPNVVQLALAALANTRWPATDTAEDHRDTGTDDLMVFDPAGTEGD